MSRLTGKTALVLGAGKPGNMGDAVARRFAAEGAQVIVAGRSAEPMIKLAKELNGRHAIMDISDESQVAKVAADWSFPRLDIIASTVGLDCHATIAETTQEMLDQLCRTHIHGPIYLLKHFTPLMRDGGAVIFVSSVTAGRTNNPPGLCAYGASKAGTDKLVQAAAVEYSPQRIRVNAIAPGLVLTPMGRRALGKMSAALEKRLINRTPLGRLATVEDIAATALYLADDECFLSGQILQASGGFDLFDCGVPANDLDAPQ